MNDAELQKDLIDFIKEQEAKPYPHVLRDVIIREVLKSIVSGEARVSGCATNHGTKKMYLEFSFYEKEVPGAGWISVKDRLPEQAGYKCLVTAEYGDRKRTVFTAFTGYGESGWWTYESLYMEKVRESDNRVHHNYHITHWMPLPEPPEEVSGCG